MKRLLIIIALAVPVPTLACCGDLQPGSRGYDNYVRMWGFAPGYRKDGTRDPRADALFARCKVPLPAMTSTLPTLPTALPLPVLLVNLPVVLPVITPVIQTVLPVAQNVIQALPPPVATPLFPVTQIMAPVAPIFRGMSQMEPLDDYEVIDTAQDAEPILE